MLIPFARSLGDCEFEHVISTRWAKKIIKEIRKWTRAKKAQPLKQTQNIAQNVLGV